MSFWHDKAPPSKPGKMHSASKAGGCFWRVAGKLLRFSFSVMGSGKQDLALALPARPPQRYLAQLFAIEYLE